MFNKKILLTLSFVLLFSACNQRGNDGNDSNSDNNSTNEVTPELTSFMAQDLKFVVHPALIKGVNAEAFGADHGETADWAKICGTDEKNWPGMNTAIKTFTLSFKKSSSVAQVILECTNGDTKVLDFPYSARTLTNWYTLLIKLDLNGQSVESMNTINKTQQNWLEFFTKTNWLLVAPEKDTIIGISQLGNIGFDYATLPLDTYEEIMKAYAYAQKDGYNAGEVNNKNVGAITFVMKKTP